MRFPLALAVSVTVALAMATLDRFAKIFVTTHPAAGGVIAAGWLSIRGTANPNLAFSLPFPRGLIAGLSAGVTIAFGWWWLSAYRQRDSWRSAALTFILAGASSNLLDRLRWGHVVDYIDVPWFTVFNLADAMITIGVGLLIMQELICWFQRRRKGNVRISNS